MNVSRAAFLQTPSRTVIRGHYIQADSLTLSSLRTRWLELAEWTTFPDDYKLFWQSVSQQEKDELLFNVGNLIFYRDTVLASLEPPTNEDMLSAHLDARYANPHNWVITQSHSKIIRRDDGYGLVGKPDYLFIANNASVPTLHAVMELKTFWKVTNDSIIELLDGPNPHIIVKLKLPGILPSAEWPYSSPVPMEGYHAGRLAVEQMYGYMVRNAKKFGVLSTVNAWVFLMRENGGKLWITRPIDSTIMDPPITILEALYYFSALVPVHGHLVETDRSGNPVTIPLANTKHPMTAPSVSGVQPRSYSQPRTSATIIYPAAESSRRYQLVADDHGDQIILEPWLANNQYGQKSFHAIFLPDLMVVVKLWDGYKSSGEGRDGEAEIYMHLQELWGKQIPQFICSADVDFCYGIILEEVQVLFNMIQMTDVYRAKHLQLEI
jgi:hypothetical protein